MKTHIVFTPVDSTQYRRTDDHGIPIDPQFRVIERRGNWVLLFDISVAGNAVKHEFRIQKLKHDIAIYPGASLEEATKMFNEKVGADNER